MIMLYFSALTGPIDKLCDSDNVMNAGDPVTTDSTDAAHQETTSRGTKSYYFWRWSKLAIMKMVKSNIHTFSRFSNKVVCAMVLPINDVSDLKTTGRDCIYHSRQIALNLCVIF